MRVLEFFGNVRSNCGRFANELTLPGRNGLDAAPHDWPLALVAGSLNIQVRPEGFPAALCDLGHGDRLKKLDNGDFQPEFVIPHDRIAGNTLPPTSDKPLRGTGHVWRAELENCESDRRVDCWMFRRIGSGISSQIELVSGQFLREALELKDGTPGTPVLVRIYEGCAISPVKL